MGYGTRPYLLGARTPLFDFEGSEFTAAGPKCKEGTARVYFGNELGVPYVLPSQPSGRS